MDEGASLTVDCEKTGECRKGGVLTSGCFIYKAKSDHGLRGVIASVGLLPDPDREASGSSDGAQVRCPIIG